MIHWLTSNREMKVWELLMIVIAVILVLLIFKFRK